MELKNKVIAITGGSSGIGKSLAVALMKEGAKVSVCSNNETKLNKAVKDTGAFGVVADVRNESELKSFADQTIEHFGGLDMWVNNAGIWVSQEKTEDADMNKIKEIFEVNVFGLMNGCRVAIRSMKSKGGVIVNVLSTAALSGRPEIAYYNASKYAGRGFSEAIREENKNIKVLSVFPGGTKTDLYRNQTHPEFEKFMTSEYVVEKMVSNLKLENPEVELVIKRPVT